jgi:hypothetical protein
MRYGRCQAAAARTRSPPRSLRGILPKLQVRHPEVMESAGHLDPHIPGVRPRMQGAIGVLVAPVSRQARVLPSETGRHSGPAAARLSHPEVVGEEGLPWTGGVGRIATSAQPRSRARLLWASLWRVRVVSLRRGSRTLCSFSVTCFRRLVLTVSAIEGRVEGPANLGRAREA